MNALPIFWVNKLLLNPWETLLLISIAYYKLENLTTNIIGQKYSYFKNYALLSAAMIVGSTKYPFLSSLFPPQSNLPPCFTESSTHFSYIERPRVEFKGPQRIPS